MRIFTPVLTAFVTVIVFASVVCADSIMITDNNAAPEFTNAFPDIADTLVDELGSQMSSPDENRAETAIWPFKKDANETSAEFKPKSTRKAFFLSMILPGLGETYVGSKRGFVLMGIEVLSWWMYSSNTNEGNDLEKDFQNYADTHWHYTDTEDIDGQALDTNYWKWLQYQFRQAGLPDDIDPMDYTLVNEQLEKTVDDSDSPIFGQSVHTLPSTKTQQYFEMIGKYPQFVYGWDDIADPSNNQTVKNEDGTINWNQHVSSVKSPLRAKYEDMRDESNKSLKAGQRGLHIMLINRVFSAIHAGRLAYKHNKKIDSELSMIKIDFVQKHIIDNKVPMLVISKKF